MGAIITAVLPVLLNLLEDAPEMLADIESAWHLLTSQAAPTSEQQAAIDTALDAAHQKLQGTLSSTTSATS